MPLLEVSLTLPNSGIYGLVGKNGTGKSSFYKTLMGITTPLEGRISGVEKSQVLLISDYTRLPNEVSLKDLCNLLSNSGVGLTDVLNDQHDTIFNSPIKHLSSGQKKIAEIALGISRQKKVFLFDEAASALDDENTYEFHKCILEASKSALVLYTTHNLQEIVDLQIPLLCIKDKKIVLHNAVNEVNLVRKFIGALH